MQKEMLRNMVRGFYDTQKLRISMGNRLVANFYAKLGRKPSQKKDDMDDDSKEILEKLKSEAELISTAIATSGHRAATVLKNREGIISDVVEYELVSNYFDFLQVEKKLNNIIAKTVSQFPIWDEFLKDVRGCGPLMAAVIISEIDPHKAKYVSSFWKYAGLDVAEDGSGRSRKKEHLVEVEYVDKDGELSKRQSITFNPFLKTKLVGVLGTSFIRSGGKYAEIYYDYKNRLENHPVHKDKTKLHKHNMAVRYMIKMFLKDLYIAWRKLEGLPVLPDYAEGKLAIIHSSNMPVSEM